MGSFPQQIRIPATYMRGGTSKGVFFVRDHLPERARVAGEARDRLLLRVLGSPDSYGKQIDGMGNASSSTSKAVIVSPSAQPGHDIDYLFGQVSIDRPFVDWSGNCGNLSAAVGGFAIHAGLIPSERIPHNGICRVRIWQANIQKTIVAHIPVTDGRVQETGSFVLDGVTFPAAEIALDFLNPADEGALFPTGNVQDQLTVPGIGTFAATFIQAGIPTIFLQAAELGYTGTESQNDINTDSAALARLETIRAHGAVAMGLIDCIEQAATRQHTPKLAFVAPPQNYTTADGREIAATDTDLVVRALSMGKLHHAMMGTAAVAIAAAAAVPGTIVNLAAGGGEKTHITFGHPSGTLRVGAQTRHTANGWEVESVTMSRSARILMDGWVHVPADCF